MSYYCKGCDNSNKIRSKNKHLKSITHNESEESFRITYSIDNPKVFDVDDIYNDIINVHKEKYYFCYVKSNFNLVFHNKFSTLYRIRST